LQTKISQLFRHTVFRVRNTDNNILAETNIGVSVKQLRPCCLARGSDVSCFAFVMI